SSHLLFLFLPPLILPLMLSLVLNLHLQQLHSCTSFLFSNSVFYFLCKVVFIVTLGLYCSELDCSLLCTSLWIKACAQCLNVNVNAHMSTCQLARKRTRLNSSH